MLWKKLHVNWFFCQDTKDFLENDPAVWSQMTCVISKLVENQWLKKRWRLADLQLFSEVINLPVSEAKWPTSISVAWIGRRCTIHGRWRGRRYWSVIMLWHWCVSLVTRWLRWVWIPVPGWVIRCWPHLYLVWNWLWGWRQCHFLWLSPWDNCSMWCWCSTAALFAAAIAADDDADGNYGDHSNNWPNGNISDVIHARTFVHSFRIVINQSWMVAIFWPSSTLWSQVHK